MGFIMELCGAMLAVAGSLIALSIAAIILYVVVTGIETCIQERKAKKVKKTKRGAKK